MKLYYIANNQLPTTKAHGLQIAKMCEAFTRQGVDCELIIPRRVIDPAIQEKDPLKYYNIKTPFKITYLKSPSFIFYSFRGIFLNKIIFWFQQFIFSWTVRKHIQNKSGLVYTRDIFVAYVLRKSRIPVYWEVHNLPEKLGYIYKTILASVSGIIAISHALKERIQETFKGKVIVAPDGVDLEEFKVLESKEELRKRLGLPDDKILLMYTGHLYPWKGVDTIVSASHHLDNRFLIVCVGGTSGDVAKYQKQERGNPGLIFLGHQPHQDISKYLKAADFLLLPNSAQEKISRLYTSPLKLFEYMAAGVPIIASDIPSLREVLNDSTSFFVQPDNGVLLAQKIMLVTQDTNLIYKVTAALNEAKKYTWDARAKAIISYVN